MSIPIHAKCISTGSPLGDLWLAALDNRLLGVWFADQKHLPDLSRCTGRTSQPVLQQAKTQLGEYFAGQRRSFDVALDLRLGTVFQQAVWQALLHLAWGSSCSYAELAARIGRPAAARAVGSAVGRNPLTIIVPCHRVLAAGGALGGYSAGLARKTALLQLEGSL